MSEIPPPIPFPTNLDTASIVTFACNLKKVGIGLQQRAMMLADQAQASSESWQGLASDAFRSRSFQRVQRVGQIGSSVDRAPDVLLHYAESIDRARSTHVEASSAYDQLVPYYPESQSALQRAINAQQQCVDSANLAAQYCANALRSIAQSITAQNTGWPWASPLRSDLLRRYEPFGSQGPFLGPSVSASPPRIPQTSQPFDFEQGLKDAKGVFKKGLWATEIYEIWVHNNAHRIDHLIKEFGRNGGKPFIRNGREVLAWKPGANLTRAEGTLAQTTARLAQIEARLATMKVVLRGGNLVASLASGGIQVAEDWDRNYSRTQRVARATTATVLEGGGAWAGFVAGAEVGAAIGVWGGLTVIPATIVGGLVGLAGAWIGGKIGSAAKETVFEEGPDELFGGSVQRNELQGAR